MTDLPDIISLFQQQHGVLGLYLTNKCNMRCRHCIVSSGPEENSRLDLESVLRQVRALARQGELRAIHVSGGEPFIYPNDLRRIAQLGSSLGLAVGVNTNASWAKNAANGVRVLKRIPGLSQLFISTDRFHREFAAIDCVFHAARAAIGLGLRVTIGVCIPDGETEEEIEELRCALGPQASDVTIFRQRLDVGGRAASLPEALRRGAVEQYPTGGCRQLNRPVVVENGGVLACCNTTVYGKVTGSPLDGGQLNANEDLSTKLKRFKQDTILQALRVFGPSFFANRLTLDAKRRLKGQYIEDDICDLCSEIMADEHFLGELQQIVKEPGVERLIQVANGIIDMGAENSSTEV